METTPPIIAVSIGNTRTAIASFTRDGGTASSRSETSRFDNTDLDAILNHVGSMVQVLASQASEAIVAMASVQTSVRDTLLTRLAEEREIEVLLVERDIPVPVGRCLDPESIVGHDRLLNAAAAFDHLKQACVVIDAGTAVTVDFVDGEGTFHGGAIAPGARMQLASMHDHADLLPDVDLVAPDGETFGHNTSQAMLHGVFYGIRGMVRHLIERYAEAYQAYPAIVATGGDGHLLFDGDELIEHVVDDLTLIGIELTVLTALRESETT